MSHNGNGKAAADDLPPGNPEAERALLASLMALPEAMSRAEIVAVRPGDFLDLAHRAIFRHLVGAWLAGQSPETLPARILAANEMSADVRLALMALIAIEMSGADAAYYAGLVREAAEQRCLWQIQRDLAQQISDRLPPDDIRAWLSASLDAIDGTRGNISGARGMIELLPSHHGLREPVIYGLLREGETLNIIAPPKTGKSWLTYGLALSVVTGKQWLGTFTPVPGKVLIVDNELHEETLVDRIPRVAEAMGLKQDEWASGVDILTLRGRLKDIHHLAEDEFAAIQPGAYKMIVIDALYRILPPDCSENDNAAMSAVYNSIDRMAARLKCAFVLIHHSTKGSQSGKAVTDVGAGAGSISRAADTHFVLRAHEELGAVVADGVTRSWAPLEPFCLRWNFPVWQRDDHLDPALLKPEKPPRRKPKAEPSDAPVEQPWTAERFVGEFASNEPQHGDAMIEAAVSAGVSDRKAGNLLKRAIATGKLHLWRCEDDKRVKLYATVKQPQLTVVDPSEAA